MNTSSGLAAAIGGRKMKGKKKPMMKGPMPGPAKVMPPSESKNPPMKARKGKKK